MTRELVPFLRIKKEKTAFKRQAAPVGLPGEARNRRVMHLTREKKGYLNISCGIHGGGGIVLLVISSLFISAQSTVGKKEGTIIPAKQ